MTREHETWMRLAIVEAELARGATGDNPWVGCVIVNQQGALIGRGHTLGPGEDHAEIAATRDAQVHGHSVAGATLYSTLEPCSFHGRTPACSRSIADRGVARVVIGMCDPHPRVNGAGTLILRKAAVEVIEGVCEPEVRRQLGPWVLEQHPHEPLRRAQTLPAPERLARLAEIYGVDYCRIAAFLVKHLLSEEGRLVLSDVMLLNSHFAAGCGRRNHEPAAAEAETLGYRTPMMLKVMFDTNVFNRILDGMVPVQALAGHVEVFATHIQLDELQRTKDQERRAALGAIFAAVITEAVPTDSFVLDVSRLGHARLGGERLVPTASAVFGISNFGQASFSSNDNLYAALKARLDSLNGAKPNNVQDALIGETSIKAGHVLVTDDTDLTVIAKEYGGQCVSVSELWARCGAAT